MKVWLVLTICFILSVANFAIGHRAGYTTARAMFAEEAIICSQELDAALGKLINECYVKCYACGHIVENGFNITRLENDRSS